jgi:hypothetical protein
VYNWSEQDVLVAYRVSNGRLVLPPFAQGSILSPGHPGGSLTVSARGSAANTGIVWASMPTSRDAKHNLAAGTLRAFNAETLAEIWNSNQVSTRDRVGNLMKFVPPVVANGKVFLPNHDNAVHVYGLLPTDFGLSVTPSAQTIAPSGTATYTVSVTAQAGFTGEVSLGASGAPSGTTVSFNSQAITSSGTSAMTVRVPAATSGNSTITVTGTSGSIVRAANPITLTVSPSRPAIGAIGIDFVGTSTATMAATERAGVISQTNWNSAAGAVRAAALPLINDSGATTSAALTWSSNSGWMTTRIADIAGNARMMKGYLDTTSTSTTTVNVTGLSPRAYDIYVYVDGSNGTAQRSGAYTISGPGITTTTVTAIDVASTNFGTTFTPANDGAGNYVKFTINADAFTITATPATASTTTRRAPVNGIQIVPVP